MQPTPSGLTAAEALALQTGARVVVDCGLEVLAFDGTVLDDWSEELIPQGSDVSWRGRDAIHRSCRLLLRGDVDLTAKHLRPWMTLSDGGVTGRWDLGVFVPGSPVRDADDAGVLSSVVGFDRLSYLATPIGAQHVVEAGEEYLDAVVALIQAIDPSGVDAPINVDSERSGTTLPASRLWEASEQHTYLAVANGLLLAVGYRALWVDHTGTYRLTPYLPPDTRAPEFTYTTDDAQTILLPERTEEADWASVPNEWVFVRDRPAVGVAGTTSDGSDGRYVVTNQSSGPTSIDARGGVVKRRGPIRVDAVDADALIAQAIETVEADRRVVATRQLRSDPNPAHDHFDVCTLEDDTLGTGRAHWTQWTLPLDGSPMQHTVEMVDSV